MIFFSFIQKATVETDYIVSAIVSISFDVKDPYLLCFW